MCKDNPWRWCQRQAPCGQSTGLPCCSSSNGGVPTGHHPSRPSKQVEAHRNEVETRPSRAPELSIRPKSAAKRQQDKGGTQYERQGGPGSRPGLTGVVSCTIFFPFGGAGKPEEESETQEMQAPRHTACGSKAAARHGACVRLGLGLGGSYTAAGKTADNAAHFHAHPPSGIIHTQIRERNRKWDWSLFQLRTLTAAVPASWTGGREGDDAYTIVGVKVA